MYTVCIISIATVTVPRLISHWRCHPRSEPIPTSKEMQCQWGWKMHDACARTFFHRVYAPGCIKEGAQIASP